MNAVGNEYDHATLTHKPVENGAQFVRENREKVYEISAVLDAVIDRKEDGGWLKFERNKGGVVLSFSLTETGKGWAIYLNFVSAAEARQWLKVNQFTVNHVHRLFLYGSQQHFTRLETPIF